MDTPDKPLVVTMGEPAGIGGELTLMAWQVRHKENIPYFFVCDDVDRLGFLARYIGLSVRAIAIDNEEEASAVWEYGVPVMPLNVEGYGGPGVLRKHTAHAVLQSIKDAVAKVTQGQASAVVTQPIHKGILYESGFTFPGHTEYLASLSGEGIEAVMLLVGEGLRVVPVTIHQPLKEAIRSLSTERIVRCGRIVEASLRRDFGIVQPCLAVCGLNPHAGEAGRLGREEQEIIIPAVQTLQQEKIDMFGPCSADTLFHPRARQRYDCVLCMYHDQALIPLKMLAFESGVNITLGLPFVRTSPDHGTALSLAGTGRCCPRSFLAALHLAKDVVFQRQNCR